MTIEIRRASVADAPALSRLGAATFRETFGKDNTPEDMARYLAESFTTEQQTVEITDPAGIVLVAEHVAEPGRSELVGYAHLVDGVAPDAVTGPVPMELKRIYVARAWQGRGVAHALMESCLEAARSRGARTLWLGVWERNPRAVAFYAKYGFARVGEHTFMLGADAQTDWLFARSLGEVSC
jgi:ribosomal protein S18 acetylase RimI-like enzyme